MSSSLTLSIIIPVYNSENIVLKTVQTIQNELDNLKIRHEIILINDGSPDNSWAIISKIAETYNNIKSINLLKNYGQHTAVFCGMKHCMGKYIITMDDDLQNPPSEIPKLLSKIEDGYDLVFGKFDSKKHKQYRKFGTRVINYLNGKIFNKPKDIILSNYRIFTKEVCKRVIQTKTFYPYIPGLLLKSASKMANVEVRHNKREEGTSNYNLSKITQLVARLLFNYSSYPLKLMTASGFIISMLSFLAGTFYLLKSIFFGSAVQGWTTLVVLLSFFNGFLIIMIGVLGEYVVRILNQVSVAEAYEVKEIIG